METYGGRSVVVIRGHKYYVLSRHRTKFNAKRQVRRSDFPRTAKVRKVGKWWALVQLLPKQYQ